MGYLDIPALRATACRDEPYSYVIVPGFVRADALDELNADFPSIRSPGSFPPEFPLLRPTLHGPDRGAEGR